MHLIILLYALFASLFGLSKSTLSYTEPVFFIGSRMTLAGILMLGYHYFYQKKEAQPKLSKKAIINLLMLGFFGIYLTNVAEIWALTRMDSAKACLLYSLSPFFAALISYIMFSESLSFKKWLGMGIGFLGVIPCVQNTCREIWCFGLSAFTSTGEILILIAVLSSVYGWILLKKSVTKDSLSPIFANACSMIFGGLLALIHSYLSNENWDPFPVYEWKGFLRNSFFIMIISNMICYNLYGFLLKRFSATFMSFAGLMTPIFASLFGWIFLNEIISWHFFASLGLFAVGLYFFHQDEIKTPKSAV